MSEAICPYCGVGWDESPIETCPGCQTQHHQDCWQENGGCTVYGCEQTPEVEPRTDNEIPRGHWGSEEKICANCGKTVRAQATRCKHCGALFEAEPSLISGDVQVSQSRGENDQKLKTMAVFASVGCLVPFFGLIAAPITYGWYAKNRTAIRRLPSIFSVIIKLGMAIGLSLTVLIVLFTSLYQG